jgi:hypothetical protein|tara:strand:+ start:393 stop:938 length:546 start_codon:yes stop_codon:yes gene_type:complete
MTKLIVTTDTDGNVTVCQPSPDARLVTTENGVVPFYKSGAIRKLPPDDIPWSETEDEFVARIRAKDVPADAPNVTIVEDSDLPGRKFRNAWKQDAEGKPQVDMPKARDLHMDRIRVIRNEELQKEDINFQRAIEADDASAKTAVATKKQALRDLPATFDLNGAGTDEELDALWPSELPERS